MRSLLFLFACITIILLLRRLRLLPPPPPETLIGSHSGLRIKTDDERWDVDNLLADAGWTMGQQGLLKY